ncbi:pancreatic lipase-related protein 2-like isoform X2 [Athalia rosae]|nr:pancreatic lipase-related protein 2-like isoform X2 [Athalia rosae]XP_012256058.2 pancreatic lipase-related protein 2-like isoform X2 [Athalia rosae]
MCKKIVQIFLVIGLSILLTQAQHYRAKIMNRRNHLMQRRINLQNKIKPQVCYDFVGCFADPPAQLSLKRPPEHPDKINTQFLLYTRENPQVPKFLVYGDGLQSISKSTYNATRNTKAFIHGFRGSGNDVGLTLGAKSILEVEDANVIIVNWERGAETSYATSVANTELVGRQLALILMDTFKLGSSPNRLHIIGFSLGAHVAGCTSEMLKKKNLLVERITGLDPASPFFKNHLIRQRSKKLDISDARFVDIIHTDGSESLVDGFGLLKPMGHVDFFPNGGREQPGCTDVKNSVVVSHQNDESLDKNIICSHLRAWQFFVESIQSQLQKCKFIAWPCPRGAADFLKGNCFPRETSLSQEMGYKTNFAAQGTFYLATRSQKPYCGAVIRACVTTSADANMYTSGILYLSIDVNNTSTEFRLRCNLKENTRAQVNFFGISTASFEAFTGNVATPVIHGSMYYDSFIIENKNESSTARPFDTILKVDAVSIEDRRGNRWEYHGPDTIVSDLETLNIKLYSSKEYGNLE